MRTCTNTGRIVYDRPKHSFSWADVLRIMRSLEPSCPPFSVVQYMTNLIIRCETRSALPIPPKTPPEPSEGPPGPKFGGAGASRSIPPRVPPEIERQLEIAEKMREDNVTLRARVAELERELEEAKGEESEEGPQDWRPPNPFATR